MSRGAPLAPWFGAGLRDLERLARAHPPAASPGAPPGERTNTASSSSSATACPGFSRQQVAVGVHRIRLDAGGAQRREPLVQQRARHHRHRRARGLAARLPMAKCSSSMSVGQVLLERVGHQLRSFAPALGGRSGSASSTSAPGTSTHTRRPARARQRQRQRPALRRPDRRAAGIDDEPGGRLIRRRAADAAAAQSAMRRSSHRLCRRAHRSCHCPCASVGGKAALDRTHLPLLRILVQEDCTS